MGHLHWYTDVLRKYAVFGGRAGRPEFWWFQFGNIVVGLAAGGVAAIAFGSSGFSAGTELYFLAVLLPTLAVEVRRLHDIDRTAWWVLLTLIPFLGPVVLLVFFLLPGTPGPNRYGEPVGEPAGA